MAEIKVDFILNIIAEIYCTVLNCSFFKFEERSHFNKQILKKSTNRLFFQLFFFASLENMNLVGQQDNAKYSEDRQ